MKNSGGHRIRLLYEIASSINVSLAIANIFFSSASHSLSNWFMNMDRAISYQLNLIPDRYAHSIPGHFAYFVPSTLLIGCLWLFLHLYANRSPGRIFLRTGAGILALIATPVAHLWLAWLAQLWWLPLMAMEVVAVTSLAIAYLIAKRPISDRVVLSFIALHFAYWFWEFGPIFEFGAYTGPLAPTAGLCASLAWFYYRKFGEQNAWLSKVD